MLDPVHKILKECKDIKEEELLDEDTDVAPGEEAIGTLSLSQKQVLTWILRVQRDDSVEKKAAMYDAMQGKKDNKLIPEIARTGSLAHILDQCLWHNIRETVGVWNQTLGLRKGWQIVKLPDMPGGFPGMPLGFPG